MRVSYNWLQELIDVPESPEELSREFIRTGTEVEAIDTVGESFDHVVTAKVVSKEPHPDSDHMWVTMVDVGGYNLGEDGSPEPLQIVCGAQNFEQGDHIVTALVGAELPGGIKIKKSKLRGVVSYGMNCSARELGLSGDHSGIMILPADAPVGVPFAEYRGTSDTVLDCEITPNRPDCLSMVGMAREVGAIFDRDTHVELPTIKQEIGRPTADEVSLAIADEGLCSRYVARIVRNVKVGPSPEWMVERLAAAGVRSINNIVDITNYVMMLTGQPLHAFDLDTFAERDGHRRVVVRGAHEGEVFQTLDGVERTLDEGMGLITDGERPVALAGVMGGMDSEIEDDTRDVLIESACFDAGRTSHTSRDLQLISEASIRFERQVDEAGCVDVANITAALIEELAGGEVAPGYVDLYPAPKVQPELVLRQERVDLICGAQISPEFIERALTRLGCTVRVDAAGAGASGVGAAAAGGAGTAGAFHVVPPSFRPDLEREIDHRTHALTVGARNEMRFAESELVELRLRSVGQSFGLVDEKNRLAARTAQMLRNAHVVRSQARARIHHKQYDVRFFNRQQRLFRHTGFYTVFCTINPAGINADKLTAFNFCTTVLTVTSQTREIRNQRISGAS